MEKIRQKAESWRGSDVKVFWGEIAACDHTVQIYSNDNFFLYTLEGFAKTGFINGESVIIIATGHHLTALNERLRNAGYDVEVLTASDQYIPLEAHEALSQFLVNDWPQEDLFNAFITRVINRARYNNRRVRAFGEMVAVLWERGLAGATVQLEKLWCELHGHDKQSFALYCAYPKSGFTQGPQESIDKICSMHSRMINGDGDPTTEIYHRHTS